MVTRRKTTAAATKEFDEECNGENESDENINHQSNKWKSNNKNFLYKKNQKSSRQKQKTPDKQRLIPPPATVQVQDNKHAWLQSNTNSLISKSTKAD